MKKHYLLIFSFLLSNSVMNAQNLVFDNTFNSNNNHSDNYDPSAESFSQPGHMRQLNDSTFLYFENKYNYQTNIVDTRVISKTVKSDGSIQEVAFVSNGYSTGINGIQYGDYDITDVVTDGINIFVLRNERYDDNGTFRFKIRVFGYVVQSNGTFNSNSTFGGGSIFVEESGSSLLNAKGTMLGDSLVIAYIYQIGGPNQVGCSLITPSGNFSVETVSNNPTSLNSQIQDILAVNKNEVYIADNASLFTNTSGNYTYTDVSRVIKWDSENNSFSADYSGNGTGISVTMPWNTQSATPIAQDFISKMLIENGKIIVAGYTREYDGSPYSISRGRISRLNVNGTLDNTFANNGTFNQSFTTDYFRWVFNDIDISPLGTYYLSGYGNVSSPTDPTQCFILSVDNSGTVNTTYGNNGFLYESTNTYSIESTCIIPGNNELENKFMIYGNEFPDGNRFLGRLKWNNSSGILELSYEILTLYPNPTKENLTIDSKKSQSITIYNSLGAIVLQQQLKSGENTISLNNLENGIYFIQSENGTTQKFVKQ